MFSNYDYIDRVWYKAETARKSRKIFIAPVHNFSTFRFSSFF